MSIDLNQLGRFFDSAISQQIRIHVDAELEKAAASFKEELRAKLMADAVTACKVVVKKMPDEQVQIVINVTP